MSLSLAPLEEIRDNLNKLLKAYPNSVERIYRARVVVDSDYGKSAVTICRDQGSIWTQGALGFLNTAILHPTHRIAAVVDKIDGVNTLVSFSIVPKDELKQ